MNKTIKKIVMVIALLSVLVEGAWIMKSHVTQKKAEVNPQAFYEDNFKLYSHMKLAEVPTYETRESNEQQLILVVDFGAWVKGGHEHIVVCTNNGKNCKTPQGRKLINLDDRSDKEAIYYKGLLSKVKENQ